VIATGPTGHYDQRANPVAKTWLQEFGVSAELVDPPRAGGFPPYRNLKKPIEIAQCQVSESASKQGQDGWFIIPVRKGRLLWRPERITHKGVAAAIITVLQSRLDAAVVLKGHPSTWPLRQYRDGNRLLIHALPAKVGTILHPTLQNQVGGQRIIEQLQLTPLTKELVLESAVALNRVLLHSPDLPESRAGSGSAGKTWVVDPSGISRYFILECSA
jgi:hypothetical protein